MRPTRLCAALASLFLVHAQSSASSNETPPPPLAGSGAPIGDASHSKIVSSCGRIAKLIGSGKVHMQSASDTAFQASRTGVYNQQQALYDPFCVVYPTKSSDVVEAYKEIRNHKIGYAVRAGGHNTNNGFSATSGILIDFQNMADVSFDAKKGVASFGPGSRWGATYEALAPHNVTVVGGRLSHVGAGLALGGGLSFLNHQHGFASDNFVELEMVLPSGKLVTVTPHNQYSDLMWAVRAGLNQFGIVTKYTSRAIHIGQFWGGTLTYAAENADAVLDAMSNFMTDPHYDVKASIVPTFSFVPTVGTVVILLLAYDGPSRPKRVFDAFFSIPHEADSTMTRPYAGSNGVTAALDFGTIMGEDSLFRTAAYRMTPKLARNLFAAAQNMSSKSQGLYNTISLDWATITKPMIRASNALGGNPYGLTEADAPFSWFILVVQSSGSQPTAHKQALFEASRAMVNSVPSTAGLPIYVSYAAPDQAPFLSFPDFKRFKSIKDKYDPHGIATKYTNGPRFDKSY